MRRKVTYAFLAIIVMSLTPAAWAVPMWARRYGVPCSTCHAFPSLQLTSTGLDFFRKGHRFDSDKADKDFSHLLSAHVETEFDVQKEMPSQFMTPDLHLHAGGALSEYFSAYVDAMTTGEFEAIYAQATKSGKDSFITARAGKFEPTIIRTYADGLMASASAPMIIEETTLGVNPFTPTRRGAGITVGGGLKSLFVEGGVINGEDVPGQVMVGRHKDVYASGEFTFPDGVSGIGLYGHRGGYDLDTPDLMGFDRYDRAAIFANVTRNAFRVAGGYLTGKDKITDERDQKISGFFVQADVHPFLKVVPFVRYESARTDTGEVARERKATLGASLNAFETDWNAARITVEVARTSGDEPHANSALINLILAF